MSEKCFQAVFEHGVLRPLEPVSLKDHEVVSLAIVTGGAGQVSSDGQRALKQREVLLSFVAQMESQSDESPQDGFTNRDHDRLIYA